MDAIRIEEFREACHRFAAAFTIPEERTADLVWLLADRATRGQPGSRR